MRHFTEPTARNLLRTPLVYGVSLNGLMVLCFVILSVYGLCGATALGSVLALVAGATGYIGLRIAERVYKSGSEEYLFWKIQSWFGPHKPDGGFFTDRPEIQISPPDTLDESGLISLKEELLELVLSVKTRLSLVLIAEKGACGATFQEIHRAGEFDFGSSLWLRRVSGFYQNHDHVYSLYRLPVTTDPLWHFSVLSKLEPDLKVAVRIDGIDPAEIKRRIEVSRRRSSGGDSGLSDIDCEVSFEEASRVLTSLSRGDERVVRCSLVVISKQKLALDTEYFCRETSSKELAVASALGLRSRTHRSHFVRAVTACDLIPNVWDPLESGASILKSLRGSPLYFSPDDSRLEALHWLVVGASGSGKSFLTGLILKRMIRAHVPISVLFIDHNRSFRRLVRQGLGTFLEPQTTASLKNGFGGVTSELDKIGAMAGIELSDLSQSSKREAIRYVLNGVEQYLRTRSSTHTVYVVLDECWNLMRDEPELVQRSFREYRKLNGAVIAVTQSLSDFLTDESGQSIFQNAPIRILLRQAEDLSQYQGVLNLNSVELARVRALRQKKSVYSECLIKTPFLSRFGRLYPEGDEHSVLRTDDIRAELIREASLGKALSPPQEDSKLWL